MINSDFIEIENQLSHAQLANLVVNQAIEQLQHFTQLPARDCKHLVEQQFTSKQINTVPINVINRQESDFINSLFN